MRALSFFFSGIGEETCFQVHLRRTDENSHRPLLRRMTGWNDFLAKRKTLSNDAIENIGERVLSNSGWPERVEEGRCGKTTKRWSFIGVKSKDTIPVVIVRHQKGDNAFL